MNYLILTFLLDKKDTTILGNRIGPGLWQISYFDKQIIYMILNESDFSIQVFFVSRNARCLSGKFAGGNGFGKRRRLCQLVTQRLHIRCIIFGHIFTDAKSIHSKCSLLFIFYLVTFYSNSINFFKFVCLFVSLLSCLTVNKLS